jgi:hypothetical protein
MSTRRKRGRTVTASPSAGKRHGRLAAVPAVVRTRIDPADASERLAYALIERHLLNRGVPVETNERALKSRIDRARDEMRTRPEGAEEARRITQGLTANGGAMLRTVERSCIELRAFAARAAVRLVALIREHGIESTAALVLLGSAAQWTALADALRDLVFERGPTAPKGEGPSFAELLKLAQSASGAARLDLLSALDVEQRTRSARDADAGTITTDELQRRVLALRANDPPTMTVDAPEPACVGDTQDDGETRHEGDMERDEGIVQEPDEGPHVGRGSRETRVSLPPPPAPPTSTPAPPQRRPMLVSNSGVMPAAPPPPPPPPPRTGQQHLDSLPGKPDGTAMFRWHTLPWSGRQVRGDSLSEDDAQRLRKEGLL